MLKDRENILNALREKPKKAYQVMRRANLPNEEACQSLLLKMRDEGLVKFDIQKANGSSDSQIHAAGLFPRRLFVSVRLGRTVCDFVGWAKARCAAPTTYLRGYPNGGHAEPVIGRAFARPVGFAHPTNFRAEQTLACLS